mmetsp:Transcript_14990/g.30470  ORF Transcript_14990/g.30470 Transcript_14990/m.30470 type:complete len:105 (-) Transcript_14990:1234-1548(-)
MELICDYSLKNSSYLHFRLLHCLQAAIAHENGRKRDTELRERGTHLESYLISEFSSSLKSFVSPLREIDDDEKVFNLHPSWYSQLFFIYLQGSKIVAGINISGE